MATTTTTRKRRTYTVRVTRMEIYKGRAIFWAAGLVSYPVIELFVHAWQITH